MVHIRHAEPADAAQWIALRAALWPDEGAAVHADDRPVLCRVEGEARRDA